MAFSIVDQKSKQTIAIANVRCLVNGDGQVFASSSIDLFALLPISWEVQLEKLLTEDRVEEALQLAANAHISSSTKQRHQQLLALLEQRTAIKHFASGRFPEALELFESCHIDPREVTSFLNHLDSYLLLTVYIMLKVINMDIDTTFPDEESRKDARLFIVDFLQRWKVKNLPSEQKKVISF